MSWSARLFTFRGIPVRAHVTFLLIVALGAMRWGEAHGTRGTLFGVLFTLALFACVLLHELAHSVVAQRFGMVVREVVLLPIGGVATLSGKPRSAWQELGIAAAGPALNIMLALLGTAAVFHYGLLPNGSGDLSKLQPNWQSLVLLLTIGNATLALFNLLPFYPLDGGRMLRAGLSLRFGEARAARWSAGIGQAGAIALGAWAITSGQVLLGIIAALLFLAASRERARATLAAPMQRLTAAQLAEVPAIELDSTLRVRDALPMLLRSQQEAFPIVEDGALLGVVLRQKLVEAAHQPEIRRQSIRTLTTFCPEVSGDLSAERALELLEERGAPIGVVVTPDYPLGLVSASQVLRKLAQLPLEFAADGPSDRDHGLPRNAA